MTFDRKLWEVNDEHFDKPGMKFTKNFSPLAETTVEQFGCNQFDNAPVPEALHSFVERFLRVLGVDCTEFSSARDICRMAMSYIESEDLYFYLIDMPVYLTHDDVHHTYRHRKTGDILDPSTIEVFKVDPEWRFPHYWAVKDIVESPEAQGLLRGGVCPPQFNSRAQAMTALLSRICEKVWGQPGWLDDLVDEMMSAHTEALKYDVRAYDYSTMERIELAMERDKLFWVAATLGVMVWFRGPDAMPFLIRYHVIYAQLFDLDERGLPHLTPGTGGEAVVDGATVYTLQDLEKTENRAADTCVCCGASVYCTKYVNVTALSYRVCSCGREVDPLDDSTYAHRTSNCLPYLRSYAPRMGFVCQRCLFKITSGLQDNIKCGRAACPNISCPHHLGANARVNALTRQRTHQLPGRS